LARTQRGCDNRPFEGLIYKASNKRGNLNEQERGFFWKQMGKCQRMDLNFVLFIIFVSLGRKKQRIRFYETIFFYHEKNLKKKQRALKTHFILFCKIIQNNHFKFS